jgi:hypothetical protein
LYEIGPAAAAPLTFLTSLIIFRGQTRQAFGLTIEQNKSAIPDKSVLVEYVRYGYYLGKGRSESRYAASGLLSKGAPLWIPLGKAADIEALARRYQILVRRGSDDNELATNLQSLRNLVKVPAAFRGADFTIFFATSRFEIVHSV